MSSLAFRCLFDRSKTACWSVTQGNRQTSRKFHASRVRKDLVAPPDPISHMRPIIYDAPPSQNQPPYLRHPYSLTEFTAGSGAGDYELQLRLLRQQLDSLHQNFWLDSNTRFYSARDAVLESLPSTATARDKEDALSEFFLQWVMQEKDWTDAYTTEWRTRNWELIALSARVEYNKLKGCIANMFKSN